VSTPSEPVSIEITTSEPGLVEISQTSPEDFDIALVGPQGPPGTAGAPGAAGAAGQGVPTGGTTGQVLQKVSATNYDTAWATPAAGGGGTGIFRGEWGPDTLATTLNMPTTLLPSMTAAGSNGSGSRSATYPAGGPTGYTGALYVQSNSTSVGSYGQVDINLGALSLTGITRVKYWIVDTDDGYYDNRKEFRTYVNGGLQFNQAGPFAWQQKIQAISSDSAVVRFGQYGLGSPDTSQSAGVYVTGIEVYTAAAPYMAGHYVTYDRRLWRSLVDNNATTPGAAGASWTEVPLGLGTPTIALDVQPYLMNVFPSGGGGVFTAAGASFNSGSWSYGGGGIMLAPGNVDFPVTVAPGTYNILHMADGDTSRGTVQWQISNAAGTTFTNLGSSYSTTNGSFLANSPKTVMGVTISEMGRRTLRAVCTVGSVGFQRVILVRAS
jgi:hypothetical protein